MLPLDFLDFLEVDKSTIRKKKNATNLSKKKTQEKEIDCEEEQYQSFEDKEIIEKNNMQIEIITKTEIVPLGNKKALKRTQTQENILRKLR